MLKLTLQCSLWGLIILGKLGHDQAADALAPCNANGNSSHAMGLLLDT